MKADKMSGQQPVRIAVFGQGGVGKSALVVRYLTRRFIWEYDPTLESIYKHKTCVDGNSVSVEILDTASADINDEMEYYPSNTDGQLSWSDGILLVYSITDRPSFDLVASLCRRLKCTCSRRGSVSDDSSPTSPTHLQSDKSPISEYSDSTEICSTCSHPRDVVIIGNKSDLISERAVGYDEGLRLASECSGSVFVETSAMDGGPEIAAAFETVCRLVMERRRQLRRRRVSGELLPSLYGGGDRNSGKWQSFRRQLLLIQTVNKFMRKLNK